MNSIERRMVGNINFSILTLQDACSLVEDSAQELSSNGHTSATGIAVHFCNAYHIALTRKDKNLARIINESDYVFTDGTPVTWVGHTVAPELKDSWQRVYGPDFMQAILGSSNKESPSHYLLGGSPETLQLLQLQLQKNFPHAVIAGAESPPFREPTQTELAERDRRILASGATYVWIGLGTPKQDWEAHRMANSIPVVAVAIGAAFDFLAGTKPQAPIWMQRSGLEWAFRLASEPRRLGKRYLWGNSVFLVESARTWSSSRSIRHRK